MNNFDFTDGKHRFELDKETRKAMAETEERLWWIENSEAPQIVKDRATELSDVLGDYFWYSRQKRRDAEEC